MPTILVDLNPSVQIIDDNILNNVGGTGNRSSDFRSYIYDRGSIYSGGINLEFGGIIAKR